MPLPPTLKIAEPEPATPSPLPSLEKAPPTWLKWAGLGSVALALLLGGLLLFGGDDLEPTAVANSGNVAEIIPTQIMATPTLGPEQKATAVTEEGNGDTTAVELTETPLEPTATATSVPKPTSPAPSTHQLIMSRDKDTLFVTNTSNVSVPLAELFLLFNDQPPFSDWTLASLQPTECILLVKGGKKPSDKIDRASCQTIMATLDLDWKDDVIVTYQNTEIADCKIKGRETCEFEWQTP